MAASESVTQTIFFIAAIVLATATVGMTYGAVQGMAGDVEAHAQTLGQRLRSDIRIVNDAAHVTTSPLTVLVKNVGAQTLHPELWTVLVDGTAHTDVTRDVLGSADDDTLGAAQTVELQVNGATIASGDHAVRVVAETGVADEFRFHQV